MIIWGRGGSGGGRRSTGEGFGKDSERGVVKIVRERIG